MDVNCANHTDTKKQIERVEEDLRLVAAEIVAMKQKNAGLDASAKAAHKRLDQVDVKIDHLEQTREDMLKLAMAIEKLAESIKSNNDALAEHDARLDNVERRAGLYALKMWQIVAGLLMTGVTGFMMSHFGIG